MGIEEAWATSTNGIPQALVDRTPDRQPIRRPDLLEDPPASNPAEDGDHDSKDVEDGTSEEKQSFQSEHTTEHPHRKVPQ
ncbi:hypothetical protein ACWGCC_29850 [Streptomyces nigrescens]